MTLTRETDAPDPWGMRLLPPYSVVVYGNGWERPSTGGAS
jgi:hypothetical protein